MVNLVYPVGSIYIAVVSTNPGALFGVGTWAAFGAGRVIVGLDSGQTEFDVVEETGGEKTHVLTAAEMPVHTHVQNSHAHVQSLPTGQTGSASAGTRDTSTTGSSADALSTAATTAVNQNAGSGSAHHILQPYIVTYMWKRTA